MKKFIPILVCVFIFSACQKSKQMIVEDLIEATNCFEKEKVNQILSNNFMFYGAYTLNKEEYLSTIDTLKIFEYQSSIMQIQNLDSIVKTEERLRSIVDSLLEVTPAIIQKKTYRFVDAIFGFSFASSYELDEDIIRIRTDKSDLLFEIKDSQTLIGEGFARGTFRKSK